LEEQIKNFKHQTEREEEGGKKKFEEKLEE
jgi:hypothetical protein